MAFSDAIIKQCGPKDMDSNNDLRVLWRMLKMMKTGFIRYLLAIISMSVVLSFFDMITAFFLKNIISRVENYAQGDIFAGLFEEVLMCVGLGLLMLCIYAVSFYVYTMEAKKGGANLQKTLYSKCMRLPYSYYEQTGSSDFMSKVINDCERASGIYGSRFRRVFMPFLMMSFYLLVMLMLSWQVTICLLFVNQGITTVDNLAAVYLLYGSMSWNLLQVGLYIPSMASYLANAKRVFEFLDLVEEPERYESNSPIPFQGDAEISIRDVTFSYDSRQDVLQHFNLDIPKGKCVALKAESGKGKSTLAKLILGLYPVNEGKIFIKGKAYEDYSLEEVRRMIGYVPQDPYLFDVSIAENIGYGKPDASHEDIVRAAKLANANDFILELENGYETRAGERGNLLSGGQRQRIAIARAILKDAPILILDEATSALDNKSEELVNEALDRLMKGRTTIVIAHRESTLSHADLVVEL